MRQQRSTAVYSGVEHLHSSIRIDTTAFLKELRTASITIITYGRDKSRAPVLYHSTYSSTTVVQQYYSNTSSSTLPQTVRTALEPWASDMLFNKTRAPIVVSLRDSMGITAREPSLASGATLTSFQHETSFLSQSSPPITPHRQTKHHGWMRHLTCVVLLLLSV